MGLDERALLVGQADGAAVAIGAPAALRAAGVGLAAGPAVPLTHAPLSLARARRVAALVLAGVLAGDGPVFWEDHLPEDVVHSDDAAADALAARVLAPLDGLPPRGRGCCARRSRRGWTIPAGRARSPACCTCTTRPSATG